MPDRQDLYLKLAKARQALQQAQSQVVELEAQLFEGEPTQTELAINESTYYHFLDTLVVGCQIIGSDWRYLYINGAAAQHERHTKVEFLGHTVMERHPGIEKTPVFAVLQHCMHERSVERSENEVHYPDGSSAWFELLVQPVPEGIFIFSQEITIRKRIEQSLLEREQQFRLFMEHAPAALAMLDTDMHYLLVSQRWLTDYRLSETNVIGRSHYDLFPDLPEQWKEIHQQCLAGAVESSGADPFPRADGSLDWVRWEIHPWRKLDGTIGGLLILSEVITERKRSEEHIRKLHRTLGVLSDINQAIVRIRHLPTLFEKACTIAVEKGDFRMAWIGLFDLQTERINPVTYTGIAASDLKKLLDTLNTLPLSRALRTGEHLICNNIQNDPMWRLWHSEASRLGYRATVVLPLIVAGEIRGVFNLYAGETDFFDEQEMRLMDEMAMDISFAIEVAEQNAQREQAEATVKRYTRRLEILHQIDRGIISATSTKEIVETALRHIRQLIPCQRANVGLLDMNQQEGVIWAVDYEGDTALEQGLRVSIGPDFFDGYDARQVKLVPDFLTMQALNPRFKQAVNEGLRSGLNVLLMDRDQPIGTLGIFANTPAYFTTEHEEIISEVGSQLAVAIRQMQLSEQLAQHTATLEQKVTERTADLQAALVRVEAILNNSPDVILLAQADLTIQQANSSFQHLFGREWHEYCGQSLLTLSQPEDANKLNKLHSIVAAQQNGRRMEVRAIRKDGTTFDAELDTRAIPGDGLVCNIRDITERKAQERQLRYHASIQESVSDAVIATDTHFRIQSWNRAAEQIYGWSAAETIGRSVGEILHTTYESEEARKRILQDFFEHSAWQSEVIQYRHDGREIYIHASVNLFRDELGQPFGVVSVNRDITERKQAQRAIIASEARYRMLAENIADVIMAFSLDRVITYMSPSCEKLLGYLPTEVEGKSHSEFIHPEDYSQVIERTRRAVAAKEIFYTNQFRLRHKAGHYIWYEVRTKIIFNENTGNVAQLISILRDITERKQAEEALRESEEKFRLLLDAAPIATVISDQTGRISLVNVQAEKLFGYGREELIGQTVEILVPAYAHNSHVHNRIAYITAPRVRPMGLGMTLYAQRKDAREVPVEIELSYIETRQGMMVMSFIMDITERKRVAAELEQQRSFLRNVIDVSPSMIFVKDYEGRFMLANPSVAAMYNTTIDALIGKTDADFNPTQQEVDDYLAADRQVITSGEMLFVEEPLTNLTGKVHWLQTTKVPIISVDGQAKYVLGVATDITERKETELALRASEEKYRSLVETMRGGLAVFDPEFRVIFVNDRFCELLGYSREEVIGKQPISFVDAADLPLVQAHLERRQGMESTAYEVPLRHKDGHPIQVLLSGSPLLDKQGQYTGSIVVATDISLQKQAEATLRQALAKEKELGDLKTRFVSMASHEFRTPLAAILAMVETLSVYRKKLPEEQIEQRFAKIKAQIGHLKSIMEDVLMLTRMQARRVEFNPVKLDLDALCRSVLDEFQSQAEVKYRLEYSVSEGIYEVLLDQKLMRQILNNLVSNALKYSPSATPIRVTLDYIADALILSVADEGIGIPEADLPHLFEPFHRATNVGAISGTGLGLVITKEAVELHGGTITVASQQDIGTTFIIRIPIPTEG